MKAEAQAMVLYEKAAAVGVEERLLVAELQQQHLVLPLNKLPSAGIGRLRDTAPVVTPVGTKRPTPMKAGVPAMVLYEKAAAVGVEERLLVAEQQQQHLVLPLLHRRNGDAETQSKEEAVGVQLLPQGVLNCVLSANLEMHSFKKSCELSKHAAGSQLLCDYKHHHEMIRLNS